MLDINPVYCDMLNETTTTATSWTLEKGECICKGFLSLHSEWAGGKEVKHKHSNNCPKYCCLYKVDGWVREAKHKHSNICIWLISLEWLIHPLQNYNIMHRKDAVCQERMMHLQRIAFPTKWVGGWVREAKHKPSPLWGGQLGGWALKSGGYSQTYYNAKPRNKGCTEY